MLIYMISGCKGKEKYFIFYCDFFFQHVIEESEVCPYFTNTYRVVGNIQGDF